MPIKKAEKNLKERRGGPGRNQGRKKGGENKRTIALREASNKALALGYSPLDIMMDNLIFWHGTAKKFGEQLERMVLDGIDEEERENALKLLRQFLAARENSQRCAVDAAPYVHPKLASIAFKGELNHKMQKIESSMSPTEAAAAWAASLKGEE